MAKTYDYHEVFSICDTNSDATTKIKVSHTYLAEDGGPIDYSQPRFLTITDDHYGHAISIPYDVWLRLVAASANQKEQ
jgi:hypothetical protein